MRVHLLVFGIRSDRPAPDDIVIDVQKIFAVGGDMQWRGCGNRIEVECRAELHEGILRALVTINPYPLGGGRTPMGDRGFGVGGISHGIR